MRNKRGNAIIDGITILIILVLFAILAIVGHNFFSDINTDIQNDDDISADGKEISNNLFVKFPELMDGLFLMALVLLTVVTIALVFVIDSHPLFFIVSILLLIGVFIVGILLANVYDDLASDEELSNSANQYPNISWVMTHLVEVIIAITFMVSIALFIKLRA